jgi:hypothetical protein
LHEPEIFALWRELDAIRYARGLPWDDTLVKIGLSVVEIVDKAIVALERSSETHDVFESPGRALTMGPAEMFSLADRNAERSSTSDLRRDATSLLERLGRIVALRMAEAEAPTRGTDAAMSAAAGSPWPMAGSRGAGAGRTRPGRVQILPR